MKRKQKNKFQKNWFREQLKLKGLNQTSVADSLGVHRSVVSHMFSGRRQMNINEAGKWASILGVPVEMVLEKAGIDLPSTIMGSKTNTAKVVGVIDPHLTVHFKDLSGPGSIAPDPTGFQNVKVLRCQTSGGPFEGMDGTLFYYLDNELSLHPDSLGRICVVKIKGKPHFLIRVVKRSFESGLNNLNLLNGVTEEVGVTLEYASPVIWMKL